MIGEYQVVSDSTSYKLAEKVNRLLKSGWQPYENIVISTHVISGNVASTFTQVMVKEQVDNTIGAQI